LSTPLETRPVRNNISNGTRAGHETEPHELFTPFKDKSSNGVYIFTQPQQATGHVSNGVKG